MRGGLCADAGMNIVHSSAYSAIPAYFVISFSWKIVTRRKKIVKRNKTVFLFILTCAANFTR